MKNNLLKTILTLLLVFVTTTFTLAQPPPDLPDNPGDNPDVPLDGGVILLLAMIGGYIIIKVWQFQQKRKLEEAKMPK